MAEIAEYMEQWPEDDDEMTSVELQRLITQTFGTDISSASICRHLLVSLKWAAVRMRYGLMISL